MGWAETRARARRTVHKTFSLPATYFAPGDDEGVACSARMHNEMKIFGDLDREQFAQILSEQNRLVLDTLEHAADAIVRKGQVEVFSDAERTVSIARFRITNILPKTDEFLRVEVVLAS